MVHNQLRSWPHAQARAESTAQNLPQSDMKCPKMTELEGALGDHGSASGSLFDSGSVSRISGYPTVELMERDGHFLIQGGAGRCLASLIPKKMINHRKTIGKP